MDQCSTLLRKTINSEHGSVDIDNIISSIQVGMENPKTSQKWKELAKAFVKEGECFAYLPMILETVRDQILESRAFLKQAENTTDPSEKIEALIRALEIDGFNVKASYALVRILMRDVQAGRYSELDGYHNYLLFPQFQILLSLAPTVDELFQLYSSSKFSNMNWSYENYMVQNGWVYKLMGKGGYGNIYIGTNGMEMVARKESIHGVDQSFLFEIAFLDFAKKQMFQGKRACPFIVDSKGYGISKNTSIIEMEYMSPLTEFKDNYSLPKRVEHIIPIAFQLFAGLAFMHKHRICHTDLKLPNVLYDPATKQLRLIDFGLAHLICDPTMTFQTNVASQFNKSTIIGNYFQMPPEALLCTSDADCALTSKKTCFNSSIDMWNAGLILITLLGSNKINVHLDARSPNLASLAFQHVLGSIDQPQTLKEWNDNNFECSQIDDTSAFNHFRKSFDANKIWTELELMYSSNLDIMLLIALLKKCMSATPKQRIYARDALNHSVFKSIRSQYLSSDHFAYLTSPWTQDQFIGARMQTIPPPVFQTNWITSKNITQRATFCQSLRDKNRTGHFGCQTLYFYDSHMWEQCQRDQRISVEPSYSEMMARIWLSYNTPNLDPVKVQEFIEFITPQRLMGLTFYDYAILQGETDEEEIFDTMCQEDFIFKTYGPK